VVASSFEKRAERDILQQSPDELSDRELIERRFDDLEKKLDRLSPPD